MAKAKFTDEQLAVYRKCIRAGLDISDIKNPEYDAEQLRELYLAKKADIDISIYNSPSIPAQTMREIRRTAQAGVDIEELVKTIAKSGKYNGDQERELLDAAREGLSLKNMLNPKLDAYQMRQIKLGERYGIDTGVYADPSFTSSQMQMLRLELMVQKVIEAIKEFFSETWNKFVDWCREEVPPEELQEAAEWSSADITSDELFSEGVCIYIANRLYAMINEHLEEDNAASVEDIAKKVAEEVEEELDSSNNYRNENEEEEESEDCEMSL